MEGAALECAFTAKVDSCCSRFSLLHEGHSGLREPITMASKRLPQSSHLYSKIGINLAWPLTGR